MSGRILALTLGFSRWGVDTGPTHCRLGTGGDDFPLGPLLLEPQTAETVIAPARPSSLWGRPLDWAEVVPYS
jgi:hypothetical protein